MGDWVKRDGRHEEGKLRESLKKRFDWNCPSRGDREVLCVSQTKPPGIQRLRTIDSTFQGSGLGFTFEAVADRLNRK